MGTKIHSDNSNRNSAASKEPPTVGTLMHTPSGGDGAIHTPPGSGSGSGSGSGAAPGPGPPIVSSSSSPSSPHSTTNPRKKHHPPAATPSFHTMIAQSTLNFRPMSSSVVMTTTNPGSNRSTFEDYRQGHGRGTRANRTAPSSLMFDGSFGGPMMPKKAHRSADTSRANSGAIVATSPRHQQHHASFASQQQQQQQQQPPPRHSTNTASSNNYPHPTPNPYYHHGHHVTMDTATGLPDSRRSKQLHRGSIQGLSQGMNLTYSACSDNPRYQNLPSLWHVLHRKTLPPVCLFNFYLHMRDHENSSEQVDFWLDVTAHELLWRLHIRATKRRLAQERAERDLRMRLDRQEMEEEEERRRIETEQWRLQEEEEAAAKGHQKQDSITADMYEPHLSAINRYLEISERGSEIELSAASSSVNLPGDMEHEYHQPGAGPITPAAAVAVALPGPSPDTGSLLARTGSESSHPADGSGGRGVGTGGGVVVIQAEPVPRAGAGVGHPYRSGTFETTTTTTTSSGAMPVPQPTPAAKKRATTSGASAVTKDDLVKSAERIYCLYLAPQAEKSIRIPSTVRRRIAQFMDSRMMDEAAVAAAGRVSSSTLMTGLDGHAAAAAAGETVPVTSSEKSDHEKSNHHSSSRSSGSMGGLMAQPDQDLGLAFAEAREIVFEEMESYYFPRFLNARAFGNMVHAHRLTRVILGLFMLFIGFSMALCMIFLNLQPRSLRAWTLIPMFIGIMLCTTFQFNICPVMAALGVSETKWMQFSKINESYILNLHRKRALKVVVVAILYTICVGTVFGLIPGHRL